MADPDPGRAYAAVANAASRGPYEVGSPAEIRVEVTRTDVLAGYAEKPSVKIADSRTFVSRAEDWWTAWRSFFDG